jgi:hypothetical protein
MSRAPGTAESIAIPPPEGQARGGIAAVSTYYGLGRGGRKGVAVMAGWGCCEVLRQKPPDCPFRSGRGALSGESPS